jgi:hypothetical protein
LQYSDILIQRLNGTKRGRRWIFPLPFIFKPPFSGYPNPGGMYRCLQILFFSTIDFLPINFSNAVEYSTVSGAAYQQHPETAIHWFYHKTGCPNFCHDQLLTGTTDSLEGFSNSTLIAGDGVRIQRNAGFDTTQPVSMK